MNWLRRSITPVMVLVAVCIGGCKTGPDYKTPEKTVPDKWSSLSPGVEADSPATEAAAWWSTLNDPVLTSLIGRCVESNLDLKHAGARIREARAARGLAASGLLPVIGVTGSYRRMESVEPQVQSGASPLSVGGTLNANGFTPSVSVRGRNFNVMQNGVGSTGSTSVTYTPGSQGAPSRQSDLFQTGLDAAWELDIFGGRQRGVEAADADLAAAEEYRHGVLASLASEVALGYIDLRTAQNRLEITKKNIEAQENTARITADRFQAGLSSELDSVRAQAQLSGTKSLAPMLEMQIETAIHRLCVLLGATPGALTEELAKPAPLPTPPATVPVGIPSDVLRRRPDIRQAERQLAAATARIGEAMADQFPKFRLTGGISGQSGTAGSLLDSANRMWSIGPGVSIPIFQGGRIRANIEAQNARQEQAAIRYEQSILTALADVENGLVAFANEQVRGNLLSESAALSEKSLQLANERYTSGLEGFLSVLVAQTSLCQAQDQVVQSQSLVLMDLVSLYKALGGGWEASGAVVANTPVEAK